MTLEEIRELDNDDLVDLYTEIVKVNHYDPCETPLFAKQLYAAGVSQYDIKKLILARMK